MSDGLIILVAVFQLAFGMYLGWQVGVVDGERKGLGDVRCDRPWCPRWAVSVHRAIEELSPTLTVTTTVYARCYRHRIPSGNAASTPAGTTEGDGS